MLTKPTGPWIPIERIEAFVQLEPALVILGLAVGGWFFYKVFLRDISLERHSRMRSHFRNLAGHLTLLSVLFLFYWGLIHVPEPGSAVLRLLSYVGLAVVLSGAVVFVKTFRILIFEYLFIGHMREGVPLLLVNLTTLLLSILIGGWIATDVFGIRLAPLLATSAIVSIVLGLALQDTLGNLFAGVALQFDKPYVIGNWIEVQNGPQKWIGQVSEISWRHTSLVGLSDEVVTIPNRIMGQAQISNFSLSDRPLVRSQVFRIPYGTSLAAVKESLIRSTLTVSSVRKDPSPLVLVTESSEHWISCKLVYFIDDYGSQWLIADQVIRTAVESLDRAGVVLAAPRISVQQVS